MSDLFKIRGGISSRARLLLGLVSWVLLILVWWGLSRSGVFPPLALPDPWHVLTAFVGLWTEYDLLGNVIQSWWRIAQAFFWSALIAIPLGLLMAGYAWLNALINPVASAMRAMPITAFVPVVLALFGTDETMKIAFLWLGMFFYLLAVVVEEAGRVDNIYLETAMTLGASRGQIFWLMFRACFPAIFSSFRILYDIGWTYVILAEMVNARKGVGYMVEAARKVLDFERVYAGIIAIGIAAFLFRWLLTVAEKKLFPWRRASVPASEPAAAIGASAKGGSNGR